MRSRCAPTASGLRKGERRGLGCGIECDVGALRAVVDGDGAECRIDRIEDKPRGGLAHLDVHDFDARQRKALQIGHKLDRIMDGNDRFRQLARRCIEGKAGLGDSAAGHRQHEHDCCGQHGSEVTHRECHRDRILGESERLALPRGIEPLFQP